MIPGGVVHSTPPLVQISLVQLNLYQGGGVESTTPRNHLGAFQSERGKSHRVPPPTCPQGAVVRHRQCAPAATRSHHQVKTIRLAPV